MIIETISVTEGRLTTLLRYFYGQAYVHAIILMNNNLNAIIFCSTTLTSIGRVCSTIKPILALFM